MLKTRINKLERKRKNITGYVKISHEALPITNSGPFQLSCNVNSLSLRRKAYLYRI